MVDARSPATRKDIATAMSMQVAARQPFCYLWVMKIEEKYISDTVRKGIGLLAEIHKRKHEAYIAGGAVRDLVIRQLGMVPGTDAEVPVHDVDIATNMPIEDLKLAFRCDSNNGEAHGTILVHYEGLVFEVTQFRVDGNYSDGRHPDSVNFTKSFKEDCARRDFTINAMGLDKDLNVIDYFGGIDDLVFRRLRAVGNPYDRMTEDSLRIIRGMRFAARFGFVIDDLTKLAMRSRLHHVKNIAMERIHDELHKCAEYGVMPFVHMIGYLSEYGIGSIFQDAGFCFDRQRMMVETLARGNMDADTIMSVFICMLPKKTMEWLRCTRKEIRMAERIRDGLIGIMSGKFGLADEKLLYSVDMAASPEFWIIAKLYRELNPYGTALGDDAVTICEYIACCRKGEPEYGKQVSAEGIQEGPEFGKRLREVILVDYKRIKDSWCNVQTREW